jgi:16S rRNA (uracil1498-N3)-methyltransferase
VAEPRPLAAQLAQPLDGAGVLLDPRAGQALMQTGPYQGAVNVLIGPEGGLSPTEVAAAQAAGYLGVRIGPRVLRTETAAVVALALLQALGGDFGS